MVNKPVILLWHHGRFKVNKTLTLLEIGCWYINYKEYIKLIFDGLNCDVKFYSKVVIQNFVFSETKWRLTSGNSSGAWVLCYAIIDI